jgi:polyisoprenoid-binding protein YceI
MSGNRHSILLGLLLLGGGPLIAAETEFTLQPESVIHLSGRGTLSGWKAQTRKVSGQWHTSTNWLNVSTNSLPAPVHSRLTATIPAASLISTGADNVEGRLIRHSVKSEEHPTIRFELDQLTLTNAQSQPTLAWEFLVQGRLLLAGATNSLTFPARLTHSEANQFKVSGITEVSLKDFGIEPFYVRPADKTIPPIRIFNDEVTLTFDLVFKPAAATGAEQK